MSAATLCLGTATLGMDYGVVVPRRAPSPEAGEALLERAWSLGVRAFDTARAYGTAETRIGAWRARTGHAPGITTKVPPIPPDVEPARFIEQSLEASLGELRAPRVAYCLLHRASDLSRPGVAATLRQLSLRGWLERFGVSAYDAGDVETALTAEGLGALQVPVSLLDLRLINTGLLARARQRGIRVSARSIFLQGVLFVTPDRLPPFLAALAPVLGGLVALSRRSGVSLGAFAFASLQASGVIDEIVFGATTLPELEANVGDARTIVPTPIVEEALRLAARSDSRCLDPRQWPAAIGA